jgi:menaquinone-specific isochorismate synthase
VTRAPDPTAFRAVCVPLTAGPEPDPVALSGEVGCLFAAPTLTLAGRGTAAVLEVPGGLEDPVALHAVVQWLAAVPCDDRVGSPGSGVVAQGALPFARNEPARLVVPAVTYGRDGRGLEWVTVVTPVDQPQPALDPDALRQSLLELCDGYEPGPPASLRDVIAVPPAEAFEESVAAALDAIASRRLDKVVLGRRIDLHFDEPVRVGRALARLHRREPGSTAFSHPIGARGGSDVGRFIGASPELLVSRRGRAVTSYPLAGTVPLSGAVSSDRSAEARLLGSGKDRVEHELVVEEIVRALRSVGAQVDKPGDPSIVRLRSVAHLGTQVTADLGDRRPLGSALELVAALHPSAAVGGVPRDRALETIIALEAAPREHWAAPVGWVDGRGDGDWVIGIRSATLGGAVARLWAGAGIVAGSDPALELAETTAKFAPLADALLEDAGDALLAEGTLAAGHQRVG